MTTAQSTAPATRTPPGRRRNRPRLAVAATYPIHPALGGGQVRASRLYRGLGEAFDVTLVTLAPPDAPAARLQLTPALTEVQIPKSAEHQARELELQMAAGTVVTDIAMTELHACSPDYLDALDQAARGAHAVVACHPYTLPAIRQVSDAPIWYEAQDVEASLKRHVLGDSPESRRLLARTEAVERACCEQAELVWACSAEDRDELVARYGIDEARVLIVPNGFALDEARYVGAHERAAAKRRLQLEDRLLAVFVASWHEPNLVAARELVRLAVRMPELELMIVGSVGLAFGGVPLPANVQLTGTVSVEFKQTILGIADAALNPVRTGSGTNLKMLDYFGSGIPVISTAFGARGLGIRAGEHYLEAQPGSFPAVIRALRGRSPAERAPLVEAARDYVVRNLSWQGITASLIAELRARDARLS